MREPVADPAWLKAELSSEILKTFSVSIRLSTTMEDTKDKATEVTEEELKGVDGTGCGCENVPVLKEKLTEEKIKDVSGGESSIQQDFVSGKAESF